MLIGLLAAAAPVLALDEATEKRLQRLERRVGHITELMLEMQALKRTNSELQGQVEELQHSIQRLKRKQQELYLDLDERISRGTSAGSPDETAQQSQVETPPQTAASVASGTEHTDSTPSLADPEQIKADYERAYALLAPSRRKYKQAIAAFEHFLNKYPENEYTDNAMYWLGETYYVTHDNAKALQTFDALLAQYPTSRKAPGALLKKGYILDAEGKRDQAREALNAVIEQYPQTSVANMARARLKHMK